MLTRNDFCLLRGFSSESSVDSMLVRRLILLH